jgi:acetyltransferase-like isoleucine patch superfamily enzyme
MMHHLIYYTNEELRDLGVTAGTDVKVHRSAHLFGGNICIGSHVRIDCNCVITSASPVAIGSYVHLGVGVTIFGSSGVVIEDFAGLSPKVSVFTESDDYTEGYLTNPTVPLAYRNLTKAPVILRKHALVGASSVVLPGVTINRGASVGALCLVRKDIAEYAVVVGPRLQTVGHRNAERLESLEASIRQEYGPLSTQPRQARQGNA